MKKSQLIGIGTAAIPSRFEALGGGTRDAHSFFPVRFPHFSLQILDRGGPSAAQTDGRRKGGQHEHS